MSSEEIIAKWRKRLKDERLAPRTISFYIETIHAVLALMEKLKLQTHPHTINAEDVQKLLDYLKDEQVDTLITFGAGNIDRFIGPITEMLCQRL